MTRINPDDYLTLKQVMAELGCPRRTLLRVTQRAEAAGRPVVEEILGKPVIRREKTWGTPLPRRSKLAVLRDFYYPYGSPAHQKMVRKWGSAGGTQKRLNREEAEQGR